MTDVFDMAGTIRANLDALSETKAAQAKFNKEMQEAIYALYTEEIQAQIEAIHVECQPMQEGLAATIKTLEEAIKADVVNHGSSVKGVYLMATYFQGRVKWDTTALIGYAAATEVFAVMKEGRPYNEEKYLAALRALPKKPWDTD